MDSISWGKAFLYWSLFFYIVFFSFFILKYRDVPRRVPLLWLGIIFVSIKLFIRPTPSLLILIYLPDESKSVHQGIWGPSQGRGPHILGLPCPPPCYSPVKYPAIFLSWRNGSQAVIFPKSCFSLVFCLVKMTDGHWPISLGFTYIPYPV